MRAADRDGHGGVAQSERGPSEKRPIDPLLAELRFTKRAGRADTRVILQVMPRFQREISPLGRARGLFCKRSGVLKGIPTLCKRYNACKVW